MKNLIEEVIKERKDTLSEAAYHDFFKSMLARFGVKSPSQLKGDRKKTFFSSIKKGWAAKKKSKK